MNVTRKKYPVMEGEPHLGTTTEIELHYELGELIEMQLELIEEGQTFEESLDHIFEVDGCEFRLGEYL